MSKKKDVGNWSEPKQNRIERAKKTATHQGRRKKKDKTRGVKSRKDLIMSEYNRMKWYQDAMEDEEKRRKVYKGRVGYSWWANWKNYYNESKLKLASLVEEAENDGIKIEDKFK